MSLACFVGANFKANYMYVLKLHMAGNDNYQYCSSKRVINLINMYK